MPSYITRIYGSGTSQHDKSSVKYKNDPSDPKAIYEGSEVAVPFDAMEAKYVVWYKIPAGSKDIRWKVTSYCAAHNASLQVFHYGTGNLLVGTPFSIDAYRNTESWTYPTNQEYTNQFHWESSPRFFANFDEYVKNGNWGARAGAMWMLGGHPVNDRTQMGRDSLISAYNMLFGGSSQYQNDLTYNSAVFSSLASTDTSSTVTTFSDKFAICLGKVLSALFPDAFPPVFVPKDSLVNGTGLPFFKEKNSLSVFNVETEKIYWTGNTLGGLSAESKQVTSTVSPKVPDDASAFGDHMFKVYTVSPAVTWAEAQAKCVAVGGHLATVTSQAKQDFIQSLLQGEAAWIGGMRHDRHAPANAKSNKWQWVNNEPWSYENWNANEPNDSANNEPYTEMYITGKWNDLQPTSTLTSYVCEWDIPFSTVMDINSLRIYKCPGNNYYYARINKTVSWRTAQAQCRALGGRLASFTERPEVSNTKWGWNMTDALSSTTVMTNGSYDFSRNVLKASYWIGAHYDPSIDRWVWEDGTQDDPTIFFPNPRLLHCLYEVREDQSIKNIRDMIPLSFPEERFVEMTCGDRNPPGAWALTASDPHPVPAYICEWDHDPRTAIDTSKEKNDNYEELYIPEARCDLIVGITSTHWFHWEASWQERTDPPRDPCVYGEPEPEQEPEPEPEPPDEPEPTDEYTYDFSWNPAYDMRLPSTVAKNADYNVFYPIEWRTTEKDKSTGEIVYQSDLPEEIQKYDAYAVQWLTHLLRYQNGGEAVCGWENLHDELAINLTDFPLLGPVLPEYQPFITSVGAKVMVACTNVQLYQASFDMKVWVGSEVQIPTGDGGKFNTPEKVKQYYHDFLLEILKEAGFFVDEDPDKLPLHQGPLVRDYFPEGKDKFWWIEPSSVYTDGEKYTYRGSWIHQKVFFNYPFPCSSVVTLYPDLGAVEGISHVGSALVCAVPGQSPDPTDPWRGEWEAYESLNQTHIDKHNFYTVGIVGEEADIILFLRRNKYLVPANILTWAEQAPWELSEDASVLDAFKEFFKWWWLKVYPSQNQMNVIQKVREARPDRPVKNHMQYSAYMREDTVWRTRRDASRRAINVSSDYVPSASFYPWSNLEDVTGSAIELCNGTVYCTTNDMVLRGKHLLYWLTSVYKDRIIGEGTDVYVGKVVKDQAKVVSVIFGHNTTPYVKMKRIRIGVIPDADYPYYQFVSLSLDGTTWQDSIYYPDAVVSDHIVSLSPASGLKSSFTFYVRVKCGSTIEDPKPVKIQVTYERSI